MLFFASFAVLYPGSYNRNREKDVSIPWHPGWLQKIGWASHETEHHQMSLDFCHFSMEIQDPFFLQVHTIYTIYVWPIFLSLRGYTAKIWLCMVQYYTSILGSWNAMAKKLLFADFAGCRARSVRVPKTRSTGWSLSSSEELPVVGCHRTPWDGYG